TDITGNLAVPNGFQGGLLGTTAAKGDVTGNVIGGTAPGAGNLISGNSGEGIRITGAVTPGNVVQGNLMGTHRAATAALPNGRQGGLLPAGASGHSLGRGRRRR